MSVTLLISCVLGRARRLVYRSTCARRVKSWAVVSIGMWLLKIKVPSLALRL